MWNTFTEFHPTRWNNVGRNSQWVCDYVRGYTRECRTMARGLQMIVNCFHGPPFRRGNVITVESRNYYRRRTVTSCFSLLLKPPGIRKKKLSVLCYWYNWFMNILFYFIKRSRLTDNQISITQIKYHNIPEQYPYAWRLRLTNSACCQLWHTDPRHGRLQWAL